MGSRGYRDNNQNIQWIEEPIHSVQMTEPYYLAVFPVTQAQFAAWTEATNLPHHYFFPNRPNNPAENVNWFNAVEFCDWISSHCATERIHGFRCGLPTEAQWEFACRAGTETEFFSGDGIGALSEVGWSGVLPGEGSTHPVGAKNRSNRNGLFDMHGNVWEWCWDEFYETTYMTRIDGVCDPCTPPRNQIVDPQSKKVRVVRGGCWMNQMAFCRSATRFFRRPFGKDKYLGFRPCLYVHRNTGNTKVEDSAADRGLSTLVSLDQRVQM